MLRTFSDRLSNVVNFAIWREGADANVIFLSISVIASVLNFHVYGYLWNKLCLCQFHGGFSLLMLL